jgi:hypothetical protein
LRPQEYSEDVAAAVPALLVICAYYLPLAGVGDPRVLAEFPLNYQPLVLAKVRQLQVNIKVCLCHLAVHLLVIVVQRAELSLFLKGGDSNSFYERFAVDAGPDPLYKVFANAWVQTQVQTEHRT